MDLRTERTQLHRERHKGHYDRATVESILDAGFLCHVAFVDDGQPYAIPTSYVRDGEHVLLHGSPAGRMLKILRGGAPVCITVTHLDGIVVARSAFNSSMNFRSVVVLGSATELTGREDKLRALELFTERVLPGRWADVRATRDAELRQTAVFRIPIEEASAKVRTGPPNDPEEAYDEPTWAGVIPVEMRALTPIDDPTLAPGRARPAYLADVRLPGAARS